MRDKPFLIGMGYLAAATLWLRLVNLGYSDYQGDEIKALSAPMAGQGLFDFLLEQRKGPVQFLISYLMRLVHPTLDNRTLTRLPFALAGIAAVYFFYRLVELHYGRRAALIASLFLAINGLFIGLARIVQYQSIVILFSILALYCTSLALIEQRWKVYGLYTGMLCWVGAVLAHFDGVFIAPLMIYLLARWYRENKGLDARRRFLHIAIPALLGALALAAFYVPYFLSLQESTQQYWWLRIAGEESEAGEPSSLFTFTLYNPLLAIYVYAALGALSLVRLRQSYPVWLWLALPWITLELLISDPGTHIYTYLLPACIMVALGTEALGDIFERLIGERISWTSVLALVRLVIVFLSAVSHLIFIDNTPEYPWEERSILLWTVGKPDTRYRLWVFGFPYYRRWEEVSEYVTQGGGDYYATNENKSISSYWVPYLFDINRAGYYIHIYYPQSFRERLADDKIRYWTKNYPPVSTYIVKHKVVVEIYSMPPGGVDEIKSQGY